MHVPVPFTKRTCLPPIIRRWGSIHLNLQSAFTSTTESQTRQQLELKVAEVARLREHRAGLESQVQGFSKTLEEVIACMDQLESSGQISASARYCNIGSYLSVYLPTSRSFLPSQTMQSASPLKRDITHKALFQPGHRSKIVQRIKGFSPCASPLLSGMSPGRAAAYGASCLASHPLTALTDSVQLPLSSDFTVGELSVQQHALKGAADDPASAGGLQARVTALEQQLTSCTSELASTCAELAAAREDLDRDEVIFAAKMQEASVLQARFAEVSEQARLLGELRREHDAEEGASSKQHRWEEGGPADSSRQPDQLLGEGSGVPLDAPSRCSSAGPELHPHTQLHQASFWEAVHRWGSFSGTRQHPERSVRVRWTNSGKHHTTLCSPLSHRGVRLTCA